MTAFSFSVPSTTAAQVLKGTIQAIRSSGLADSPAMKNKLQREIVPGILGNDLASAIKLWHRLGPSASQEAFLVLLFKIVDQRFTGVLLYLVGIACDKDDPDDGSYHQDNDAGHQSVGDGDPGKS